MNRIIITSLIFISIFFSNRYFGNKEDSLYCIEINGRVTIPKSDPYKNYKLLLLCNNVVVDSGEVVDDEEFLLRVKKNSLYTIRILKPGYLPMMVSVNTRLSQLDGRQKFNFTDNCFLNLYGFHLTLSLLNQPMLADSKTLEQVAED